MIAVLALLTAVAPLATDMYLPAFPAMAAELGVSASAIQLTLTAFMVGLAIGQLVIGPLSDQFGRRPLLIGGTALCVVASAACALAPSIALLGAARFLQGLTGAAGLVLGRAIISDRAKGAAAAKMFSLMMVITGVAPVAAPLVGGALIAHIGWRGVFWVLTGVAVVMMVGVLVWIAETHPQDQRMRGGLPALLQNAKGLLINRGFVCYTIAFGFSFAVLFAYIAASPFVLQEMLGLSQTWFSVAFAGNAVGLIAMSTINARLVDRVSPVTLLRIGVTGLLVFSSALLVDGLIGPQRWLTLLLLFSTVACLGLVMANATALAIGGATGAAGTASAILGALQAGLAALVSPLVGLGGTATMVPMAVVMVTSAVIAVAATGLASRLTGAGVGNRSDGEEPRRLG
ncbi:multidrug effflux MFS transporter [Mycolicibacterium sp. XJ870]